MSLIYQSPDHRVQGKRPGIYLGGKSDAKSKQKLLDRGITHVLNLTPPKEASIQAGVPNYFERDGTFTYHRIPVYDSTTSVAALRDAADDVCQFISTALCHGSILVHCQRGVSRSVTAVLLYLVRRVEMSPDEAIALVKRRRPEADPIPEFLALVREYHSEKEINGVMDGKEDTMDALPNPKRLRIVGPQRPPAQPCSSDIVSQSTQPPKTNGSTARRPMIGPTRPPVETETDVGGPKRKEC